MDINTEKYKLSEKNFYSREYKKNKIIIGNTGNDKMKHFYGWENRLNGNYKKTSTFTIDRNGKIYQHFNPLYYSDFIGDKHIDKQSITISLVNQGRLKKDLLKNTFYDWVGNIYDRKVRVYEKRWRGFDYWDPYTPKQYKAVLELVEYLCNIYNIPKRSISHNTYLDTFQSFDGVSYVSNYNKDRYDLSPAWDCKKLKNKLENEKYL